MIAGESAGVEAQRQLRRAAALETAAGVARATAKRFAIAHRTEEETARLLAPLGAIGYHLLADRRWPGSRHAQVDMVVVGPGGVFIVDTKAWSETAISDGRMFRGQEDVTDDIARLADLRYGAEAVLAEVGLAPNEVHAVVALAGRKGIRAEVASVDVRGALDLIAHITAYQRRLPGPQVDAVLLACMRHFAPMNGALDEDIPDLTVPTPVLPRTPLDLSGVEHRAAEELEADLVTGMLDAPIEAWMATLDPAQAKLVRRNFNGPSRIRGAAGTGKTVVGLHRAAYLARSTGQRVLVATYIRTLPAVLGSLLTRLAPDVKDRVDFSGIHQFAIKVLKDRAVPARLDGMEAKRALYEAWNGVDADSPLRSKRFSFAYWEDEIGSVIKGRGLTRFEEYADLARVGRKHPLTLDQRQAVWDLYSAYDESLRRRGVVDYADVILLARDSLRADPLRDYEAVIVDEAQDLSCAMVAMLHALVGNRPDGLTLIGDGQQTIYPGGYTLGEIGISVAGRGVVLDVNHRNTAEILAFAKDLVAGDDYVDIEGVDGSGDAVSAVTKTGPAPVIRRFPSWAEHDDAIVPRVREVLRLVDTSLGDIGILTRTNTDADRVMTALAEAGIASVSLKKYNGIPIAAVKVGTIKRAKGLEFKQVLLPRVRTSLLDERPKADARESDRERHALDRRELYVGMTRARDGLWVGVH
ncbi:MULTISPECIES: UvrD-helicase domain-containing protein [unclassified Curtobacterium]|uniref:nuclease-related domain-containing DEAD/DEAH box helicase n=1 Tax=unclassified Curtobacterium TaxID=257496 RepID=UPI000DA8BAEF|nr:MULTISPECIES: UvrD-helicase domain-containing protein [unclassified Curtobacterium]WIB64621.1 3'-5' exonuclease [Curtobacterium sp. MCBD17_040]WIB68463.1 3'-5' exonuclease [Curtobacterium sp. MCBD17_035]